MRQARKARWHRPGNGGKAKGHHKGEGRGLARTGRVVAQDEIEPPGGRDKFYVNRPDDFTVFGKASELVLREHAPSFGENVELTAPAGRDLRVDSDRVLELGRETRGPFVVPASGWAEEDLDGHVKTLVVEFQHGLVPARPS